MTPEAKKETKRQWYLRNRERILQKNREYRAQNPEEEKERYRLKRESILAQKKAWYEANKAEIQAKRKARYEQNKPEELARNREYKARAMTDIRKVIRKEADERQARIAAMRAEYARRLGNC